MSQNIGPGHFGQAWVSQFFLTLGIYRVKPHFKFVVRVLLENSAGNLTIYVRFSYYLLIKQTAYPATYSVGSKQWGQKHHIN